MLVKTIEKQSFFITGSSHVQITASIYLLYPNQYLLFFRLLSLTLSFLIFSLSTPPPFVFLFFGEHYWKESGSPTGNCKQSFSHPRDLEILLMNCDTRAHLTVLKNQRKHSLKGRNAILYSPILPDRSWKMLLEYLLYSVLKNKEYKYVFQTHRSNIWQSIYSIPTP